MPRKPPNGQAQSGSYLLVFDLDDDGQRKLKHVLVGLLLAIHTVQTQTGKALDLLQFIASFVTGLVGGHSGAGGYHITEATLPEELPSMFAGTEHHAAPQEARENFSAGMGDLFDDDDDDLW
jgi:hypothetical protein